MNQTSQPSLYVLLQLCISLQMCSEDLWRKWKKNGVFIDMGGSTLRVVHLEKY